MADDTQFEGPSYTEEEIASGLPEHDSTLERAKTLGEGALQGALGPVGTAAAIGLGSDPQMMRERASAHPIAHGLSELAGFAGSTLAGAGMAPVAGRLGAAVGGGATGLAAEMGLLSAGDEVSKLITHDPDQSLGNAVAHVGASALLGFGTGAALKGAGQLFEATAGNKIKGFIDDFKSQVDNRIRTPEPVEALTKELQDHYSNITSMADDVYGAGGLKAQDIAKAVPPEMTTKIADQASVLHQDINTLISKAEAEPGIYGGQKLNALREYRDRLTQALTSEGSDNTINIYNALNDFKKDTGPLKKWSGEAEQPVSKLIGDVYGNVQSALEDVDVWGKAAERQQRLNKAFSEFLPSLKDFRRTFTANVGGDFMVDPNKVNTYVNGLGKPSAEIKQAKLENFINASEKYQHAIETSHANLGLEPVGQSSPLTFAKGTLGDMTAGAKLANAMVDRGLAKFGGRAIGGTIGGSFGHLIGSPGMGVLIGEHALGPLFESVLPALTKPILGNLASAEGLKGAIDYSMAVAKGEQMLTKAVTNVFKSVGPSIPEHLIPTEKSINNLKEGLRAAEADPSTLINSGTKVAHYLPDHAAAISAAALNITSTLQKLKPNTSPQGPLEDDRIPDKMEEARYNKALQLAEQPALILNKVKDGTISMGEMALVNSLHPGFIKSIQPKLMGAIADQVAKGELIPYKTRMGLSVILGQPLDGSLKGLNIASNQIIKKPGGSPQEQGSQSEGQKKTALQKLSGMYNTPIQAREQEKTNGS